MPRFFKFIVKDTSDFAKILFSVSCGFFVKESFFILVDDTFLFPAFYSMCLPVNFIVVNQINNNHQFSDFFREIKL